MSAVVAGCSQTKMLGSDAASIAGRPVAVLRNPAVPMKAETDPNDVQVASSGLAVALIDMSLKAATGTYEKAAQVARPSVDPAKIVEDKLLADLASRYHTSGSSSLALALKPVTGGGSWPDKNRVNAVVAGAQSQGFGGIVMDLVPLRYEALTRGHGLAIGGAKVAFSYVANLALVDAADGKLLASGFCSVAPGFNTPRLSAVLEGGQGFVDGKVRQLAEECAAEISRRALTGQ